MTKEMKDKYDEETSKFNEIMQYRKYVYDTIHKFGLYIMEEFKKADPSYSEFKIENDSDSVYDEVTVQMSNSYSKIVMGLTLKRDFENIEDVFSSDVLLSNNSIFHKLNIRLLVSLIGNARGVSYQIVLANGNTQIFELTCSKSKKFGSIQIKQKKYVCDCEIILKHDNGEVETYDFNLENLIEVFEKNYS
jgi:hypothetical protein